MVLEALINPVGAERKPWISLILGFLYSSVAILVSLLLFRDFSSMVAVALTAMASVPLIYGAIKMEEKKDLQSSDEVFLLKEHSRVLSFFMWMFLGYVISFTLWYAVLPEHITLTLFEAQIAAVSQINSHVPSVADASPVTGNLINTGSAVGIIFVNNMKVLMFCLLFAFFYGFGAIFILAWNASVLSTVIGSFLREAEGAVFLAPVILFKYSLHGIPEIAAYFLAGLAGGIISIAVIRHDFGSKKFKNIVIDSLDLTLVSIALLAIAAVIEVFISPLVI